jgi:hypothetical protein
MRFVRYFLRYLGRRLRYLDYRIRGIQTCSLMGSQPICSAPLADCYYEECLAYLLGERDSLIRVFVKVDEPGGGLDWDGKV